VGSGGNVDTPGVTTVRHITSGPPTSLPLTITAPAQGSTLATSSTTVTGIDAAAVSVRRLCHRRDGANLLVGPGNCAESR
jgi:hypothetical protein